MSVKSTGGQESRVQLLCIGGEQDMDGVSHGLGQNQRGGLYLHASQIADLSWVKTTLLISDPSLTR